MENKPFISVHKGFSDNPDTASAIRQIASELGHSNPSVTAIFFSSYYDISILEAGISRLFTGPVICCSTAGEIGEKGYSRFSISAFSICSNVLSVKLFPINTVNLSDNNFFPDTVSPVKDFLNKTSDVSTKHFATILLDGLSGMEESLVAGISDSLPDIPIIGGSAGDDLRYDKTYIYIDGKFRSSSALLALFSTSLPFKTFKSQHFSATEKKALVTKADPSKRLVYELNNAPAASVFSRLIGVPKEHLCADIFARYPLMLNVNNEYYIRLIRQINNDDSLSTFCSIIEEEELNIGKPGDIVKELENSFIEVENSIGPVALTIGFDCVHRRLESNSRRLDFPMKAVFDRYNVIGFNTYGEQINSMHVNQTFTGIAIGSPP